MGDATKPCFAKRKKERGALDDEELKRNPLQQGYHPRADYGHGKKIWAFGRKREHKVTVETDSEKDNIVF